MGNIYEHYICNNMDNITSLLKKIVNIDSSSYCKNGIDKVGQIMAQEFIKLGFNIETIENPHGGNGIVARNAGGLKKLLLIGHLDTVFPEGSAQTSPYHEKNQTAYGPGVLDMKGCLIACLYALKALYNNNADPMIGITVIMSGDEEIGSFNMRDVYRREAQNADWAIVIEAAREHGEVVVERKGGAYLTVTAHGKAAHAGIQPETGRNAIEELALKIAKLRQLNGLDAGTTVSVGKISGGTVRNVVAEDARMEVDLRFSTMDAGEKLFESIRQILAASEIDGVQLDFSIKISRPPLVPINGTAELIDAVRKSSDELGIPYVTAKTGGLSDGNILCGLGVPTIDGLGPVGGRMCTPDEYLDLSSFPKRAARLALTIEKLGQSLRNINKK